MLRALSENKLILSQAGISVKSFYFFEIRYIQMIGFPRMIQSLEIKSLFKSFSSIHSMRY